MKYYKFFLKTFVDKIVQILTDEQYSKCYRTGYPVDGPVFVPCDYISDKFYKELEDYENSLNPYK